MKKESRALYVYSERGFLIGFLLRKESFDRVYIGCRGGDFLRRVMSDSAFKQARKAFFLRGSERVDELDILGAEEAVNEELYNLARSIIFSLTLLAGEDACSSAQSAGA